MGRLFAARDATKPHTSAEVRRLVCQVYIYISLSLSLSLSLSFYLYLYLYLYLSLYIYIYISIYVYVGGSARCARCCQDGPIR